ncbi:ATP-binding protein [Peterkaempfera sp. SMS 1(5)a]|uniref:sensor histidine kinase n=1 Tax=Peterkaempfera podocarpi TaxID=3232308 RepID=UPI00366F1095
MRRHAESLIILSGAAPGRMWRRPVPLVEVVGSAVGEVEDYTRVVVPPMPEVSVVGAAVADVIHLVAELVENATAFSPPQTQVTMRAGAVAHGFVLEIDDRGLGMDPEELAGANRTLTRAGEVDLTRAERLGLFVVGRLADRHGIEVTLCRSPYGGTTAVVFLPAAVLAEGAAAAAPAGADPLAAADPSAPHTAERAAVEQPDDTPARVLAAVPATSAATGTLPRRGPRTQPAEPPAAALPGAPSAEAPSIEALSIEAPSAEASALPRRVRQAGLAPQLREAPAPSVPSAPSAGAGGGQEVTPEQLGAVFGAFQRGLVRGRGGEPPQQPRQPGTDQDTPTAGTTEERDEP